MNFPIDLNILSTEPAEEYHAQAGKHLSSHQLIDFMSCPWLYRKKQLGLVQDNDTTALLIGRATHCRVLEGREAYEAQFAIGGPINPKTNRPFGSATKAFAQWAESRGKPVLTHEQVELIEKMASGVAMNSEAIDLLLHGRSEGVLRADYCGTACQIRLDWVHPHRGIVDLKTTTDLAWFENECKRRRYHNQLAFYQAVLGQVTKSLVPVYLIGIEKLEPFRCGVWQITENTLAIARQENEAGIQRLLRSREIDAFPTGYEEVRLLDVA